MLLLKITTVQAVTFTRTVLITKEIVTGGLNGKIYPSFSTAEGN